MWRTARHMKLPPAGASFLSAILVAFLSVACLSRVDSEVAAWVGTERINREITLTLLTEDPTQIRLNGPIHLLLENRSTSQITLPPDFGSRLFVFSDKTGEWREVENQVQYLPADQPVVLSPRGELPWDEAGVSVIPLASETPDLSQLRILVAGNEENGEIVVAYIDLELSH